MGNATNFYTIFLYNIFIGANNIFTEFRERSGQLVCYTLMRGGHRVLTRVVGGQRLCQICEQRDVIFILGGLAVQISFYRYQVNLQTKALITQNKSKYATYWSYIGFLLYYFNVDDRGRRPPAPSSPYPPYGVENSSKSQYKC